MAWDTNIGRKVLVAILLAVVIVTVAGLAGIYGMSWINKSLNEIVSVNLPGTIALEVIREAQTAIQRDERTLLLRRVFSDEEKARLTKGIEGAWIRADGARKVYETLSKSKEAANAWNMIKPAWEAWKKDHQRVFNLAMEERLTEATVISQGIALESFDKVEGLMGEVIAINEKDSRATTEKAQKTAEFLKSALIGALVLSIILMVAIGIGIKRDATHIIMGLKDEVRTIVDAAIEGKLTMRGDPEKVNVEFRDIVKGFNDTLDAVNRPLKVAADYLERISQGETPPVIRDNYDGDFNLIKNNLNAWIDTTDQQVRAAQKFAAGDLSVRIQARNERDLVAESMNSAMASMDELRKEVQRLTKTAQEGLLSERGRTEQLQGVFADIIQSVNEMLDAILAPIDEGDRILQLIRDGNLRQKIEIICKGDQGRRKDVINGIHTRLNELVAYIGKIASGDLTATISKDSEEDQIHQWLVLIKNNIDALIGDTFILAKAAAEGNFTKRADTEKHHGDFRKIVSDINEILNAINEPLKAATEYKERLSKGEISPQITVDYKGDSNSVFFEMIARNKPYF